MSQSTCIAQGEATRHDSVAYSPLFAEGQRQMQAGYLSAMGSEDKERQSCDGCCSNLLGKTSIHSGGYRENGAVREEIQDATEGAGGLAGMVINREILVIMRAANSS